MQKKTAVKTSDKAFNHLDKRIKASQKCEWAINYIEEAANQILTIVEEDGFFFVYGKGKRKIVIQRQCDELMK